MTGTRVESAMIKLMADFETKPFYIWSFVLSEVFVRYFRSPQRILHGVRVHVYVDTLERHVQRNLLAYKLTQNLSEI